MQLDADDDEAVFYRQMGQGQAGQHAANGRGDTAVDRARAKIHEDSD